MRQRSVFLRLLCVLIAAIVLQLMVFDARAACYGPRQRLPTQVVTDFISNPAQILQQYPNGGAAMISRIRDLAATDPATLQPILTLLASANKDQKTAIGSALGQAARICVPTDQAYASSIQQALAEAKDEDAVLAYASVAGDQPIASTAATGTGTAGGAVGGPTNPLSSTGFATSALQSLGSFGTNTFAFTYTSSVSGTTTSITTTTTVSVSVSP